MKGYRAVHVGAQARITDRAKEEFPDAVERASELLRQSLRRYGRILEPVTYLEHRDVPHRTDVITALAKVWKRQSRRGPR